MFNNFNSVDDFTDVMCRRCGFHYPEGQPHDGLQLFGMSDVDLSYTDPAAPDVESFADTCDYPEPVRRALCTAIRGEFENYYDADYRNVAEYYDALGVCCDVVGVGYDFMDCPASLDRIFGSDCWNVDGMSWHLYCSETNMVGDAEGAWPDGESMMMVLGYPDDVETAAYVEQFGQCMSDGDWDKAAGALKALGLDLAYGNIGLTLSI